MFYLLLSGCWFSNLPLKDAEFVATYAHHGPEEIQDRMKHVGATSAHQINRTYPVAHLVYQSEPNGGCAVDESAVGMSCAKAEEEHLAMLRYTIRGAGPQGGTLDVELHVLPGFTGKVLQESLQLAADLFSDERPTIQILKR